MDHPHRFHSGLEERARWRIITKKAYEDHLYPCFRVKSDNLKSLAYRVEYCWLPSNLYLAISHSWEDRTGPGDTITVDDLAPWTLTMSPAKAQILKWLNQLQHQTALEGGSAWFWLDLLCIDQSEEDEPFSAMQIQTIPEIFGQANGSLALLVSHPCVLASKFAEESENTGSRSNDSEKGWQDLERWANAHHSYCKCSPFIDAWMTRVWTRQELLYSKSIAFYPVMQWLVDGESFVDADVWQRMPSAYYDITPRAGVREFASCLYTWATKNNKMLSSTEIATIARTLLRGETAVIQVSDLRPSPRTAVRIEDWFALNWNIIQNGSIRRTTYAVDAILSQMLLLPGYITPEFPRTTSLQDISRDASLQFRRLVQSHQLIPRSLALWDSSGEQLLLNMWHAPTQPMMSDILERIGSPCQILRSTAGGNQNILPVSNSPSPILACQTAGNPIYRIEQELDVFKEPYEAVDFFVRLEKFWTKLKGHATEHRVRIRLREISDIYGQNLSSASSWSPEILSRALQEVVWCILDPPDPTVDQVQGNSRGVVSVGGKLLPLRAARVTYSDPDENKSRSPSEHVALIFGNLPRHSTGPVFSLGIDKAHGCEVGVTGEVGNDSSELRLKGFGALMPVAERKVPISANATDADKFYRVTGGDFTTK